MIDSVLNVFKVFVSLWHANFTEQVLELVLSVCVLISQSLILTVQLLSECFLSFFAVNLGKLLHFHFVFCHEVFLFLCQISQVLSGTSAEYLS